MSPQGQAPQGPRREVRAFAPGRVNLIGEHTDYNQGLALAFAIEEGVTVRARAPAAGSAQVGRVQALAHDLDEHDEFELPRPGPAPGWRSYVRGAAAELSRAGLAPAGALLEISGDLPRGAGLSSSAALEVALSLALLGLAGAEQRIERDALAILCSRVENEWAGAHTGLLDQFASLHGAADTALLIDFRTLAMESVELDLEGWRLVTVDSGQRRSNASSGYNGRREECARAAELLGVGSLRDASQEQLSALPEPIASRARHVLGDNARARAAFAALRMRDLPALAGVLNAAHASLRDELEVSTPQVERAVRELRAAGAQGARLLGGGFGGSVLGLFPPGAKLPANARVAHAGAGARLLEG